MQANRQQAKGQEGQRNQAKARMLSNQRASSPVFWSLPFCVFESSQVKFILPTKINNTAPPLVSGAGSSRAAGKSVCHFCVFEIIRNCCHECRLRVPSTECIPSHLHLPSPEVSLSRRLSICGPASPRCGYWANWGFLYSAPQDLVVLGVFCARFPPRREANIF